MSTPHDPGQNPDDGTPQDPSDPQNPYGTPPTTPPPPNDPTIDPPAPPASPAPPTTPIPPAPSAPPPYGDPSAPPPAVSPPAAPYGQTDPTYGQPQPAYGQPQPVWQQPGGPQYGAPAPAEAGKGLAITSLVLAILGCTCVSLLVAVPMAIVVLVRGRDGRNHGKGLAIAALVISAIYAVGWVIGGAAVYDYAKDLKSVNDLEAGDCITANGLTDSGADTIDTIKAVSCSDKHDGEVLATTKVTAELAKDFSTMDPQATCGPAIDAAGKTAVLTEDINVTALSVSDPKEGDNIACVAYHTDGSKLTGRLGS